MADQQIFVITAEASGEVTPAYATEQPEANESPNEEETHDG